MAGILLTVEQTLSEFKQRNLEEIEQNLAILRDEITSLDMKLMLLKSDDPEHIQIKKTKVSKVKRYNLLNNTLSRVRSYVPIMERLLQELRDGMEIQLLIELFHISISTVSVDALAELGEWNDCLTTLRAKYSTAVDDLIREIIQIMRPHRSIWKLILRKFDSSIELLSDSVKSSLGPIVENDFGEVISYLFEDKQEGAGKYFGGNAIFTYHPSDALGPKQVVKFFVKGHQNFELESNKTTHSTRDPKPPDMKEILVYKILERLGYGPKTHYFINETATHGLFIATQDCAFTRYPDLKNKIFRTAEKVQGLAEESSLADEIDVTALDIITRSLVLKDLHARNYGRVDVFPAVGSNAQEKHKWKLFDFLVTNKVKSYDNHRRIGEDFVRGEYHPDHRFMSSSSPAGSILDSEHLAAHRHEVANIAIRILEGELRRGSGAPEMSFTDAMEASRQEIRKFIVEEGLGLGVGPEEALNDIERYCEATARNYLALKERIVFMKEAPI